LKREVPYKQTTSQRLGREERRRKKKKKEKKKKKDLFWE